MPSSDDRAAWFATALPTCVARGEVLHAAGVWDGLSARIAAEAGYQVFFLSGAALSASRGLPDAELITADDVAAATREVTRVTDAAVMVDLDTGFGDEITLHHLVREIERAGAAAVMIEDQASPKVGAIEPGQPPSLATPSQIAAKIAAAKDATQGRLAVVVRSDAGPDQMKERLLHYGRAGADALFPLVLDDRMPIAEWREVHERSGLPLVCTLAPGTWIERNMDDRTASSVGIALVVHSLHALLASVGAMSSAYAALKQGTPPSEVSARSVAYREVQRIVRGDELRQLRQRLAASGPAEG